MDDDALVKADFTFGNSSVSCYRRRPESSCQRCWTIQDTEPQNAGEEAVRDDIGLDVWPATTVLCSYLASHAGLVRGAASVLELGAGVGVAGILALALGAQSVTLTDYDPQVLAVLQRNLELNHTGKRGSVRRLDWKSWRAGQQPGLGAHDLLLGADLLYTSAAVQDFVETVKLLLAPEGALLLAHQMRRSVSQFRLTQLHQAHADVQRLLVHLIMKDAQTGLPRLEDFDAPLERFKALAWKAGLQLRELARLQPDEGKMDTGAEGSFCLLGVAWRADVLAQLPPKQHV